MAVPTASRFKDYYSLAKPGIIYGNLITTIGGFVLASRGRVDVGLLIATLAGISLVMASGGAFNNYLDRDIDALMERTRDRPLVAGRITRRPALIYGTCLGAAGFFLLIFYTNLLAAAVAAIGFFFYVVMYTIWAKRRSVYGTVVGSVSGAVPPVVGYCAASGRLDGGALILFLILALWQMPHFFAIGIYRRDEYAAASLPILPVRNGIRAAKIAMLFYVVAFTAAAVALAAFGYAGFGYLVVAALLGAGWLALAVSGFWAKNDRRWARAMFFASLGVLVILFIAISAGALFSPRVT
jgi:heme o synthase